MNLIYLCIALILIGAASTTYLYKKTKLKKDLFYSIMFLICFPIIILNIALLQKDDSCVSKNLIVEAILFGLTLFNPIFLLLVRFCKNQKLVDRFRGIYSAIAVIAFSYAIIGIVVGSTIFGLSCDSIGLSPIWVVFD